MAQAPQTGMEKGEMKQLLAKSKQEPVSAAFGQSGAKGGDSFAVLMLSKAKAPKAVHKELETKFGDAKNTRWGTALVEPEIDATLVKFVVNRECTGMAKRLSKTLKGTGYRKVEIYLEGGGKIDGAVEEDDEVQVQGTTSGVTAPTTQPGQDDGGQLAQLQKTLTDLVRGIPAAAGTDTARKDLLTKVARMAMEQLKTGDVAGAGITIAKLGQAMGVQPGQTPNGSTPNGSTPTPTPTTSPYAKPVQDWTEARQKVIDDIARLRSTLVSTYQAQGISAEVEKSYDKVVAPLLGAFDTTLATKLDQAGKVTDPSQRATLVEEARGIMGRYTKVLSHPLIAELDTNPFVPLSIQKTLSTTLQGMAAAVK